MEAFTTKLTRDYNGSISFCTKDDLNLNHQNADKKRIKHAPDEEQRRRLISINSGGPPLT